MIQTGFIHFRQFPAVLVQLTEKAPSSARAEQGFFSLDLSISGNVQQLSFQLGEKPLPPTLNRENDFRLDLSISGNFQQLQVQLEEKAPPQLELRSGFFFTMNLPISGNFQQIWDQLAEKLPPPIAKQGYILDWIYPFQPISCKFGFSQNIYLSPLQEPNSEFLYWIHPFKTISGNFGFSFQESPPPQEPKRENFQTGFINFKQFLAILGSAGRKFPRSQIEKLFRLDLSIPGNFQQLWVQLAEKALPSQLNMDIYLNWIYPFQAISNNFGFSWQNSPPPPGAKQGKFLDCIY